MSIHPTAMVDPSARIDSSAEIGPYVFIGPRVIVEAGCVLEHHASIWRDTTLGAGTRVWSFASLGTDPQDLKYQGELTRLVIGKNNKIREFTTMNRGTAPGGGVTTVGDNGFYMAYVHVAHDCHTGNNVIMANSSHLAGHVTIEDYAILGGLTAVHQFARVGAYVFLGGASAVSQDLPPYTLCDGNRAKTHGLNLVGLKRAGFSLEVIKALKEAYRIMLREPHTLKEAAENVRTMVPDFPEVRKFVDFIVSSERGVAR